MRVAVLAAGAVLFPCRLPAGDLSNTNWDKLQHFWKATDQTNRPTTVVSLGDSVADSYRSIPFVLMGRFGGVLGFAGYAMNNSWNTLLLQTTNGTIIYHGPTEYWFTTQVYLPTGGGLWWESQANAGGILSDKAGLCFASQPGGGDILISISTNGGPWAPLLTVSGYSPTPLGHYTNIALALDYHRLRVDGLGGTNIIIGPQLVNSQSAGIVAAFTDEPGISLQNITNVPVTIRGPVFNGLAPDLIIWHMKEDGTDATRQGLIECEGWLSNSVPNSDVLYIGTPYSAIDDTTNWTIGQNTIVHSIAVQYGRAYMDCMNPSISFDWMQAMGYMADNTHPDLSGSEYLVGYNWNGMGFFALGAPQSLSIQRSNGMALVSYLTAPGIQYGLETASDLRNWQSLLTVQGDGSKVSAALVLTNAFQTFRLHLRPGTN